MGARSLARAASRESLATAVHVPPSRMHDAMLTSSSSAAGPYSLSSPTVARAMPSTVSSTGENMQRASGTRPVSCAAHVPGSRNSHLAIVCFVVIVLQGPTWRQQASPMAAAT